MPKLEAEEFCQAFYTWAEACQRNCPLMMRTRSDGEKNSLTIGVS